MVRRLLPLFVLATLLLGFQAAAAQPAAPRVSAVAETLVRYLPAAEDLPAGVRFSGPISETSNEDVAALSPLIAEDIQRYGRLTDVSRTLTRAAGPGSITVVVGLFTSAEGAWQSARNSFEDDPTVETIEPGPAFGERSVLFHYFRGTGASRSERYLLAFQRDRLELNVLLIGPPGGVSVEEMLPLAGAMDARVAAAPPGPVTAAERSLLERTPTLLVRGAVRILLNNFVDELEVDQLFAEAWAGAAEALRAAGVTDIPPTPSYPRDEEAAITLHLQTFPALERLAEGRLTEQDLAYAAVRALARGRNDCHTYFQTPEQYRATRVQAAGGPTFGFGFSLALDEPVRVVSVVPGSPAKAAGMRRGQLVLAINGQSVAGLDVERARGLLNRTAGAINTFLMQNPDGTRVELRIAPAEYRVPPLESEILEGNIGYMRWYSFLDTLEQYDLIRQTLREWEDQGVVGWIIDLRDNSGGSRARREQITSLFVEGGRLTGDLTRGQPPVYTNASGVVLPFQRPIVFIVNEGSASAGEILPAVLQARGRAVVVGEKTAGCIGSTRAYGLMDGSALYATLIEYTIGPEDVRLHRIGVSPNVEAPAPTFEEEDAGVDPQRAAALSVMRRLTGQPILPMPAPPKGNHAVVVAEF